ncbi:MAG TPA: N-acetylglucosamine-6-phosphate deacetylase, partial [Lachnospiraceae bacterium]|nr:N-acetylglucosamine-6-phosphate deacetylase [Lachnospiraceae bacterium]
EGARFLGLHLEGPYVSPQQAGAQDPKYIRRPDPAEYKMLADACPYIVRWTIAPEVEGALQMAEFLRGRGILPSIGHSNATYDQVKEAVKHGFTHVTHLYSGCSTITRKGGFRYPGVIESAYLIDELTVEIIADGCHLPAPLLQMVMRFIGPQRTCLITDASRGAGQPDGESILGSLENGQKVIIEDGVAKLPDRSAFAGSVATCDRLVRTMINMAHVSLPEAIDMMTARPAAIIGKEDVTGTLEKGRLADLIFFDESINILLTMVGGKIIYRKVEKNE